MDEPSSPGTAMARESKRETTMTLCPVALAAGCRKCPIFSICPLKSQIGDYTPGPETPKKDEKK
jgi:hypothetical protein